MKCRIMQHSIWVSTVWHSAHLGVKCITRHIFKKDIRLHFNCRICFRPIWLYLLLFVTQCHPTCFKPIQGTKSLLNSPKTAAVIVIKALCRRHFKCWYVHIGLMCRRLVQLCERSECYRVLSHWTQALTKVLASVRDSSRKVYRLKIRDGYQNNNGFSLGTK